MEAATVHAPATRRPRFHRTITDERLVELLRTGDEGAFEVLYDRYHADLLSFCRHMLGTREEAEDALQHVFVDAHRQLRSSDKEINLRPWLYAIARNRCLTVLRTRRAAVALDDVGEPQTAGLAVEIEIERRQDLKDLLADLKRLPADQRAALVLSELRALSHEEVAEALEVRPEKVKALVFQAREGLMGWREARAADCQSICEFLATARGADLRRAPIRRHLDVCPDCRDYREQLRSQRAALALLLPVVPSVGLKPNVLAAALRGSSMGPAAAAGGAAVVGVATGGVGGLGSGLVAKGLAVAAIAAGAGSGALVVSHGAGGQATARPVGVDPAASTTHRPTPAPTRHVARLRPAHVRRRHAAAPPQRRRHATPGGKQAGTWPAGTGTASVPAPAGPIAALPVLSGAAPAVTEDHTGVAPGRRSGSDRSAHPDHPVHPGHPAHPDHPASPQSDGEPGLALGQDRSPPPPGRSGNS